MNPFVLILLLFFLPKRFGKYNQKQRIRAARMVWSKTDQTIKFAAGLTVAIVGGLFLFAFTKGCPSGEPCDSSGYYYFLNASPNEVGDTLAGVAGTLAFLWLIVTVMLQGKELSAQRRELRLARKESRRMADALGVQAEIFKDEQRQRREQAAKEHLDELLIGLMQGLSEVTTSWTIQNLNHSTVQSLSGPTKYVDGKLFLFEQNESDDQLELFDFMRLQYERVKLLSKILVEFKSEGRVLDCPAPDQLLAVQGSLRRTLKVFESLSTAQQERVRNMGLLGMQRILGEISNLDVWNYSEEGPRN